MSNLRFRYILCVIGLSAVLPTLAIAVDSVHRNRFHALNSCDTSKVFGVFRWFVRTSNFMLHATILNVVSAFEACYLIVVVVVVVVVIVVVLSHLHGSISRLSAVELARL